MPNVLLLVALSLFAAAQRAEPVRVVIETNAGQIEIEIDATRAPVTAANFLKYVAAGLYDGGRFHRTVTPDNQPNNPIKIEVIQGAANAERRAEFLPPITLERTSVTGLRHRDGTVSMARTTPDSATHEFFICIGEQPELDFGGKRNPDGQGFAAFGHVTRGMDVVRTIQGRPANAQSLAPPIPILKMVRAGR